ncbi:nuclear factor erythroid 2-related factor 2b isoform X2 [Salminus brasiliensis]|uniref:nuclear factor erythroid 2-related factor 2b isoform X2 n=1 Tax=Salminus brasiliensis TaxID=930266 RepID=UPI003B82CAB2
MSTFRRERRTDRGQGHKRKRGGKERGDDSTTFDPCIELMTEAFLSGQGSPITQNPLLSALLFSKKPPAEEEKASIEPLPLPDLQHYLDALEAHVPESLQELLGKTVDNYNHQLHEPQDNNTAINTVSDPHVLAHSHSGATEIMQTPAYAASHSGETTQPLAQILPEAPDLEQPLSDAEDLTESFLDTIMSTSPPENVDQRTCELSSSLSTQEELYPELENTVAPEHLLCLAQSHSGHAAIMQTPAYAASHSGETTQPLAQILPEEPDLEQSLSDAEDLTESFLDTIMSTRPPENLDQRTCEMSLSLSTQEEQYPELENTVAPEHLLCQYESVQKDSSQTTGLTLFSLESSRESIDLDLSLYGDDPFCTFQSEAEEAGCSQSDHTELFNLSLLSEAVDLQPPLLLPTETNLQNLMQDEMLSDLSEPSTERETNTEFLCDTKATSQPPQGHRSWSVCRDEQRARTLRLPLSVDHIITMSVEAFNEAISTYELNEGQLSLMRDIRRRGKNKMAAQTCRKRKLDSLVDLESEVKALQNKRESGMRERERNIRALRETRTKLSKLYNEVFSQLRDEHGNPYSPKEYTLQYSTDGRVFILPRTPHANKHT